MITKQQKFLFFFFVKLYKLQISQLIRLVHMRLTCPYVLSPPPGHYEALKPSVAFEFLQEPTVGQVALAFLQASFAYSGWNFLNYVTEEVVEPRKYVPPGGFSVSTCWLKWTQFSSVFWKKRKI